MIVAIDPGTTESGVVIVPNDLRQILYAGKLENEQVLDLLECPFDYMERWHKDHHPDDLLPQMAHERQHVVIEMIASYGMPVGASTFETCVWIGRFVETVLRETHASIDYVYRKEEKQTLCGSLRAKDSNIRQALIDRFGPAGTKKDPGYFYGVKKDAWQAAAVAVTYHDREFM